MIKFNRCAPPQVLTDHQAEWTKALTDAVAAYGGYGRIPKAEREDLVSHYRHRDIQAALFGSSHGKCAYCECKPAVGGYAEVEHFLPKSRYPALAFDWDNLLPACRRCNDAKLDLDPRAEPIIDPSRADPEALLAYDFLRIRPRGEGGEAETARRTIERCGLNRSQLYGERADLLHTLTQYMDRLREELAKLRSADTPRKRGIRLTRLRNSLDEIDVLLGDDRPHAGFSRWLVQQFPEYREARTLAEEGGFSA